MRGIICYYSGTGNTKLACEAIASRTSAIDFDSHNIVRDGSPELAEYDMVGFATWADFLNPPQRMKAFLESVPRQAGKPAFVFNTYGSISARTLVTLDRWVHASGFHIIAGHSLHTPENYPPMVKRGLGFIDSPNERELASFNAFIAQLDSLAMALSRGEDVPARRLGLSRFMPALSRAFSRKSMGEKLVDADACTACGVCRDRCPCGAIALDPKPVFDQAKCCGCWVCYNHCPTQAIFTKSIKSVPQYAGPHAALRRKLMG